MTIANSLTSAIAQALLTHLSGHTLKIALIKPSPTGSYGVATASYATLTGNGDEITGTGYTVGGKVLANLTVGNSGAISWLSFDTVIWTVATFSTRGALIYDTSDSNCAVGVIDFGETKTVVANSFSVIPPATGAGTAALRLGV